MIWAAYFLVKWLAYVAWCGLGVQRFRGESPRPLLTAIGLGTARFFLGAGFGIAILFAVNALAASAGAGKVGVTAFLVYLAVYVPTRWLEWSILFGLIRPGVGLRAGLLGGARADRMWRLGGILISCLADIPIVVSVGGLPVGRILC